MKCNFNKVLLISLNINGIPLFKSLVSSFWPILGCINKYIFPLALTYGHKPSDLEFLNESIKDLKVLLNNGIQINGEVYRFVLNVITCDAPAKSFVKGVKQFNGKKGCDKFHTHSKNINGSSVYIGTDFICRIDISALEYIRYIRLLSKFTIVNFESSLPLLIIYVTRHLQI